MRTVLLCGALCAALIGSSAHGEPYWVAYEGDAMPEDVGWWRGWGDREGFGHGGATRYIQDGAIVLDSLADWSIFDYYEIERPIDPGPGETFVAEWRVRVDEPSDLGDAGVVIARDEPAGHVAFDFGPDGVSIDTEHLFFSVDPGVFHTYRFESADMHAYRFYADGSLLHEGSFKDVSLLHSFVNFGDGVYGRRSLSRWDYFRFGAVPEPGSVTLAVAVLGLFGLTLRCGRDN